MSIPLWFLLALGCAFFWAAADALSKRALREHSAPAVLWARWGYSLPFLALPLLIIPIPPLDRVFWTVLAVSGPLEVAAMLLYLNAIRISPLSRTVPLLAWTPVFTALFSFLVLGEVPGLPGGLGIFLVGAGSYLLYFRRGEGLLAPLLALRRDRGGLQMLAVALIFSFTSALGKVGIRHSSPAFFGFGYVAFLFCVYSLWAVPRERGRVREVLSPNRWFLTVGAAAGLMTILHFAALELTQVAYMISVKRSSLLFAVVLGRLFFREGDLRGRFAGAAVMVAGVSLILIGT